MTKTKRDRPMSVREMRLAKEKARTALIAALAPVVDLSTLTDGDDEYDYFVAIPPDQLHEIGLRIVQIEYDVNAKFGVWVRVFPTIGTLAASALAESA